MMVSGHKIIAFLRFKWALPVVGVMLCLFFLSVGHTVVKARLSAEIYQSRLADLTREYADLRERYNAAVTRSAVTELVVAQGKLSVRIKSAAGVIKTIPVPCDPAAEIYVDYIIQDGRLWIRRVFDARTPPERATVIDPAWACLDWDDEKLDHGKAVYRQLDEGCWIITVTGNGSLGLVKTTRSASENLVSPPSIADFHKATELARGEVDDIGLADVIRHLFRKR
ncbi:MAG: hypothetical protein RRC34_01705 [Lentisphaeria bacterium]|nr:hypothetical protein [Lentisphaeria bacterium]